MSLLIFVQSRTTAEIQQHKIQRYMRATGLQLEAETKTRIHQAQTDSTMDQYERLMIPFVILISPDKPESFKFKLYMDDNIFVLPMLRNCSFPLDVVIAIIHTHSCSTCVAAADFWEQQSYHVIMILRVAKFISGCTAIFTCFITSGFLFPFATCRMTRKEHDKSCASHFLVRLLCVCVTDGQRT